MGSFVCGSVSFPCSDYGVGLHLRGNALGRSGSDDYVPGGDVAIRLIPDLLSRGTATVLRVFVVIPSLLHPTKIAVYVCGPIRGSCLIGSVVEGVFY